MVVTYYTLYFYLFQEDWVTMAFKFSCSSTLIINYIFNLQTLLSGQEAQTSARFTLEEITSEIPATVFCFS